MLGEQPQGRCLCALVQAPTWRAGFNKLAGTRLRIDLVQRLQNELHKRALAAARQCAGPLDKRARLWKGRDMGGRRQQTR